MKETRVIQSVKGCIVCGKNVPPVRGVKSGLKRGEMLCATCGSTGKRPSKCPACGVIHLDYAPHRYCPRHTSYRTVEDNDTWARVTLRHHGI